MRNPRCKEGVIISLHITPQLEQTLNQQQCLWGLFLTSGSQCLTTSRISGELPIHAWWSSYTTDLHATLTTACMWPPMELTMSYTDYRMSVIITLSSPSQVADSHDSHHHKLLTHVTNLCMQLTVTRGWTHWLTDHCTQLTNTCHWPSHAANHSRQLTVIAAVHHWMQQTIAGSTSP